MGNLSVIGAGCGDAGNLTREGYEIISDAEVVIGAKRLLSDLPQTLREKKTLLPMTNVEEILAAVQSIPGKRIALLFSGDVGFYSGARRVLEALGDEAEVIPGISSLSYFFSKIHRSYEDVALHSAHGRKVDVLSDVGNGKPNFYLTGGGTRVCDIAQTLVEAGLSGTTLWVGSRLSYPTEEICNMTAQEAAFWTGSDDRELAVVLVDEVPAFPPHLPGLPDDAFLRERDDKDRLIPMTKQVIRREVLCELDPAKGDVAWDIGAGTGSVSVELAHFAKRVYAVEKNPAAVALLRKNRERFSCWNMHIVEGEASEVCTDLPKPDVVFIGGSGGSLREIFALLPRENVTVAMTAVTLDTLEEARALFLQYGYQCRIRQMQVNELTPKGGSQMLLANNPVFVLVGKN